MPMDLVHVHHVTAVATGTPGLVSYLVCTHEGLQFFTLNPFRASLCTQAGALGAGVRVTWKDGRMKTRDIVAVELDDVP